MVDRITPAVTAETREFVQDTFGIDDQCPVVSEAYLQWVLEDKLLNTRPHLETVPVLVHLESGWVEVKVQFTDDVKPFETIKMRLLNGSHSALAYVAYLMGHRRVDQAMLGSACAHLCSTVYGRRYYAYALGHTGWHQPRGI